MDKSGFSAVGVMRRATSSQPENSTRLGRPTREQAKARHEALLDRALEHFLERGFEQATIEAIAADVNMTKRTVYARHTDKAALFLAAVRRGIDGLALSPETIAATRVDDLEQTLFNIARLRINLVGTDRGLKLQRIINTEAYRFPEIFTLYYDIAAQPTIQFLADILHKETLAGRLAIDEPMVAANTFMGMTVSRSVRFLIAGHRLETAEIEARVAFSVKLFLNGARPRT